MRRLIICCGIALIAVAAYPSGITGQNAPRALAPNERSESRGEVTFARDVAPSLYANCAYSHRPGEVAPVSLLSYKEARPGQVATEQAARASPAHRRTPRCRGGLRGTSLRSDTSSPPQFTPTAVQACVTAFTTGPVGP